MSDKCEPVSVSPFAGNLGCAKLTPLGDRCGAVQLEINPAVEVSFLVEMVVYGSVDSDKFLQTSHTPEPLHRAFPSSKWQV